MFFISKRIEVSASHRLALPYESKCSNLHGHNWIITIHCKGEDLNAGGMLIDFTEIKRLIHERLDHRNLCDVLPFNPTAENIAKWVTETVPCCYKASVQETEGNIATYIKDED